MTGTHPLLVDVASVLRRLGVRQEIHREVALQGLKVLSTRVPDDATIALDAFVESTASGGVSVHGSVTATWVGECRRCLGGVEGTLQGTFEEVFESHPTEGETYPLLEDHIDLEPMVRDAILLALPLAPLCRDGCRGPNPDEFPVEKVGDPEPGDAPEGEGRRVDPRWAALDQLRADEAPSGDE